jgi:hypothetical protein
MNQTPHELTPAELAQAQADTDALAAEFPDTVESLLAELADDIPHRRAHAIAADYLARYTRLLATAARERTTQRGQEMREARDRGRVSICAGMRNIARMLDDQADAFAEQPAPAAPVEEQPAPLTLGDRADHAIGLYATTAVELEDARAELAKVLRWHKEDGDQLTKMRSTIDQLRTERAELIKQRDRITHDTVAALAAPLTAAERQFLTFALDEAADEMANRDGFTDADRAALAKFRRMAAGHAAPAVEEQQPAPVLRFPQLAVPCPRCEAPAGQLCTSHNGTRTRRTETHQARTEAHHAQEAGR